MRTCHFTTLLLAGAAFCSSASVLAASQEWQLHGFVSQGFLKSEGNNFYGDSLDGSDELMEAGLNASWRLNEKLRFAGQAITRDAGASENGDLRVDYLFADYKLGESDNAGIGVHIGRVRNSYGFYNETRDVIFTRPTILMPQAVYFEGNGLRELLFSSDGVQLYGYWDEPGHSTNFKFSVGRDTSLSKESLANLSGGSPNFRKGELESPIYAQLMHNRDGGRTRYAISYVDITLRAESAMFGLPSSLTANGIALSTEHNFAKLSLSAEYSLFDVDTYVGSTALQTSQSSSFYLQSRYRLNNAFSATLRHEYSHTKEQSPGSDHSHSRHWVLGSQWTPAPAWLVALDLYYMDGTGGIPAIDNRNRSLDQYTTLIAAMIAYRF